MEFGFSSIDLVEFVNRGLGFRINTQAKAVNLLGLKGFSSPAPGTGSLNKNEPDFYNDGLLAIWHDELEAKHKTYIATVEPGRKYTVNPLNPGGAAHLPECRVIEYKWGTHRGNKALVPAHPGRETCWRDLNGNYHLDPDEKLYTGDFQLRIHSGGTNAQSIGGWSAGCIAVFGGNEGDQWQELLDILETHPFNVFRLVISRGYDLHSWLMLKELGRIEEFRATVHLGSKGKHVEYLQQLLNKRHSMELVIDGDYGYKTLSAFLTAQRNIGEPNPRAICGPGQWQRLQGVHGPYTPPEGF